MSDAQHKNLETIDGAGGDGDVGAGELKEYNQAISDIVNCAKFYNEWRSDGFATRNNLWPGQDYRGIKKGGSSGKEAKPYEGSADSRIPNVDTTIRERVDLLMTALMRAQIECEPVGGAADPEKAQKATVLLNWAIGRFGSEWLEQHEILWNYMMQDTPAVAMMRFGWQSEPVIEMEKLTREELAERIAAEYGQGEAEADENAPNNQQEAQQAVMMLETALATPGGENPEVDEWLVATILSAVEGIKPVRAKKIAKQLRQGKDAEYPKVTSEIGRPTLAARRFGEDFFIPDYCRRFNDSMWFETEWIAGSELRARAERGEWDEKFVEDVIAKGSTPIFPIWSYTYGTREQTTRDSDLHKGEYQVAWVWHISTNEDGIRGRYYCIMHPGSERTAFGRRLYRESASRWPAVLHRHESVDNYVLNSRSVADVSGATQWLVKYMTDNAWNNGDISSLSTLVSQGFSNMGDIAMRKLGHIPLPRQADLKFLTPPQFPASALQIIDRLTVMDDRRWGRRGKDVDPTIVQIMEERLTGMALSRVEDELQILLDFLFNNMSDADLAMVLEEGKPIARGMEEIEGRYDVRVRFNPMTLNWESQAKLMKVVLPAIQALDTGKVFDNDVAVIDIARTNFPNLPHVIRSKNKGLDEEMRDEQHNLMLIRNGMVPSMDESGKWNYQARADMYKEMEQKSQIVPAPASWGVQVQVPQVWADMGLDKYRVLLAWREALDKQAQQHGENAEIGRSMVKGADGVQAEPGE